MKAHDLMQKPKPREAELYQALKLWQLLPRAPNDDSWRLGRDEWSRGGRYLPVVRVVMTIGEHR